MKRVTKLKMVPGLSKARTDINSFKNDNPAPSTMMYPQKSFKDAPYQVEDNVSCVPQYTFPKVFNRVEMAKYL